MKVKLKSMQFLIGNRKREVSLTEAQKFPLVLPHTETELTAVQCLTMWLLPMSVPTSSPRLRFAIFIIQAKKVSLSLLDGNKTHNSGKILDLTGSGGFP